MSAATDAVLSATPKKPRPLWFEILFGILLPIVCFVTDLSVLSVSSVAPLALWGIAALGISALLLSHINTPPIIRAVIVGMLYAAGLAAALIGVTLLPLSLVGLVVFGIGLLGFVPFLTALVFCNRAVRLQTTLKPDAVLPILAGLLILIGAPTIAQIIDTRWIGTQIELVRNSDGENRLAALRALNAYPFTIGRADRVACGISASDEPTMRELQKLMGSDFEARCNSLLD